MNLTDCVSFFYDENSFVLQIARCMIYDFALRQLSPVCGEIATAIKFFDSWTNVIVVVEPSANGVIDIARDRCGLRTNRLNRVARDAWRDVPICRHHVFCYVLIRGRIASNNDRGENHKHEPPQT